MRRIFGLSLAVVCLLTALGCSGKGKKKHPAFDAGPADSGDGTADYDANVPEQMKHDAGKVAPGDPETGLKGGCAADSNKIFTISTGSMPFPNTPLAVDPDRSQFALPYVGESVSCQDAVFLATLIGASSGPKPTSKLAFDPCGLVRAPAMTAVDGHWLVAEVDNHLAPFDVWVQPFDTVKNAMGASVRVTQTNGEERALELVTLRNGAVLLAWVDTLLDGSGVLHVRPLDSMGNPAGDDVVLDSWKAAAGDPAANPKLMFGQLAFATLGDAGAGLGYWRYDPITFATSEIVFLVLDDKGKPTAQPWVLSHNAGDFASVAVDSNDENGGAIVYTQAEAQTGRQVWFQQIDDTGKAAPLSASVGTAPALRIVNSPMRAIDVSIAKLRSQYAVVYRSLSTDKQPRALIRLMFLDRNGGPLGDSDVSFTSDTGGRTQVRVANDGRGVIGWSDVGETGKSTIKVARIGCLGG